MIRFLYTADWHLKGVTPRRRTDDYKEAVKAKLREVFQLARKWEVTAILTPGDIWDTFIVSIATLLEFTDFINAENYTHIPIETTFGQHDVQGYNKESLYRTSLALTERLVTSLKIDTDPAYALLYTDGVDTAVELTFTPYSRKMDIDGYGYSPENEATGPLGKYGEPYRIHIAHGTLLDHEPPFDKYTLIEDVVTSADLVLTGDYHPGYATTTRPDGKIFCNPGSLTRLKASTGEMERVIKVALVTIDKGTADIKLIPLASAKPGDEVLDRSQLEADNARAYAMDQFSMLIESKTGEKVLLDIAQIVEQIAKLEGAAPHIVKAALEIIDEQREKVKP